MSWLTDAFTGSWPVGTLTQPLPSGDISNAVLNKLQYVCKATEINTQVDTCPIVATTCPNLKVECTNDATQRFECDTGAMIDAALGVIQKQDVLGIAKKLSVPVPASGELPDIKTAVTTYLDNLCESQSQSTETIQRAINCQNSDGLNAMATSKLDQRAACSLAGFSTLVEGVRIESVAAANKKVKAKFWGITGAVIGVFAIILLAIILGIRH